MSKKTAYTSLIVAMSVLLLLFYSKIIFSPNSYLFTTGGDALKNYFVFASYVKNNSSFTEFEQMNYPYQESILFIDSQPSIAIPLKIMANWFPGLANYSLGIMNSLLLLSFFITSIILFKIFRLLNINSALAILGAIGITMLNPQVLRLDGHFALAYSFFIPLVIYFILRVNQGKKQIRYIGLIAITIFIAFFTHAYLGLICASIVLLFGAIKLILKPFNKKEPIKISLLYLVSGILPLIVFMGLSSLLDNHIGRTTNPWGLFHYHADWNTIFLPNSGVLSNLKSILFGDLKQTKEGLSYIGFATSFMLAIFVLSSIYYGLIKRKLVQNVFNPKNSSLVILLIASSLLLLLSMNPFRWGMESLLEQFSLIKQFRSIGRFAWSFYFISTIFIIYISNKLFEKLQEKNKDFAYLVVFIIPISLFVESIDYHTKISKDYQASKNIFVEQYTDSGLLEVIQSIPDKNYQAFIPIPFFLVGSENFELYRGKYNYQFAMLFNYFSDIPMFANMSARTSIIESKKMMQLFSSDFYDKKIQEDMPNKDPFLVLFHKNNVSKNEYNLIGKSTRIFENTNWYLGEIEFDTLFTKTNQEEWNLYNKKKTELFERNGFLVSDSSSYFEFLDHGKSELISFDTNENSLEIDAKVFTLLGLIKKDGPKLGDHYKVRFWIYNNGENFGQDMTKGLAFYDKPYDGSSHWLKPMIKPSFSLEINQNWTLVELPLHFNEPLVDHRVIFLKDKRMTQRTYIKDVLIYKDGVEIYKEMENNGKKYLFKNNHRILVNE